MRFHMIDADERLIPSQRKPFGRLHADEQGSDQAGTLGYRDEIYVRAIDRGNGFFDDGNDGLDMPPAGKLGEYASVALMDIGRG